MTCATTFNDLRPTVVIPSAYSRLVTEGLSRKRIEALGRSLRAGTLTPDSTEWDTYVRYLREQDSLREQVEGRVRACVGDGVTVTGRTKSTDTLREKLTRQPEIQLPYIRDVVGVRVVGDFDLTRQDALGASIASEFGDRTEFIDRRILPQSGYRALHVIIHFDNSRAEIQVRTLLQAEWADLYERLADTWGRQIRYGSDPDPDPDGRVADRQELIGELKELSLDFISQYEQAIVRRALSEQSHQTRRSLRGQPAPVIARAMRARQLDEEYMGALGEWRDSLLRSLEALARMADATA